MGVVLSEHKATRGRPEKVHPPLLCDYEAPIAVAPYKTTVFADELKLETSCCCGMMRAALGEVSEWPKEHAWKVCIR